MSRYLETSVYSLEGNSIWEVALKFERLGLQEISKTPQTVFQGQDLIDTKASFNFKMQFDKFFSLIKEFHVKIMSGSRSLNDNIDAEVDDQFRLAIIEFGDRADVTLKKSRDVFKEKMTKSTASPPDTDEQLKILQKRLNLEIGKGNLVERYWRLTEIIQPVVQKNLNENFTLFEENGQLFAQIEGQFEDAMRNTEEAIKLKLKERPEIRSRIDTRTAIRLTRFEGSASNVLRDVLITTSNMAEEIKNKRIVLQESLKNDDKLKKSMKNDNVLIIDYFKELGPIPEIEKSYSEPFIKVLDNHKIIDTFLNEL
jgi:hypothetical protein